MPPERTHDTTNSSPLSPAGWTVVCLKCIVLSPTYHVTYIVYCIARCSFENTIIQAKSMFVSFL